jgi:hypothetical protein
VTIVLVTAPEPKGKLDTMTAMAFAMAMADLNVNGPEDDVPGWDAIDWRTCEDNVRRLRQRIFTATRVGDLKRVRNLQKLMLRSRSNALVAVRRVTQLNAGRKTAGVDGVVVRPDHQRTPERGHRTPLFRRWRTVPARPHPSRRPGHRGMRPCHTRS